MSSKLSGSTTKVGPSASATTLVEEIRVAQSEERGGVAVTFWQLQTTASRQHISHMLQMKRTEDLHDCPHWHSGAAVLHSAAFLLRCPKADGGSCLVDGGATCDACRRLSSGHENVVRLMELPLPIGIVVVVTICAVGHFSFAETFCGAPAWTGQSELSSGYEHQEGKTHQCWHDHGWLIREHSKHPGR